MSFVPKKEECFEFSMYNEAFFELLREDDFARVLNYPPLFNDELTVTPSQATQLSMLMSEKGVFRSWKGGQDLWDLFLSFFSDSGGFVVR